ncbi:MAG: ABC transporter ATP-binding protein [Solirubrobacteraceae bacterium MAG38_C4-C5]|nr:ABC transporter ATP-binding protein [Candidatus Siliceabacter maunaloa]
MSDLLELEGLHVAYGDRLAVPGASLTVGAGESVGLVGPSGSGKSTLVAAALGLLPGEARVDGGTARFRGEDLLAASPGRLRALRGAQIGYVTQDAMRALNPTMRAGRQVAEAMTVHGASPPRAAERLGELLALVGLAAEHADAYPHELSGGQRQRIALAAAIANEPDLLVADEPTTGLDVVVQRRLLDLLSGLRERMGLALLLISHDERVVARLCDRVQRLGPWGQPPSPVQPVRPAAPRAGRGDAPAYENPHASAYGGSHPPATAAPLLELRGVSATYRRRAGRGRAVPALREVDLTLRRGEIVGLVGRSGAGKSTLALLALGLIAPSAGEVRIEGRPLAALGRRARRQQRSRMHLIFQDAYDALPERLTVQRVLAEPLVIQGRRPDREGLADALARAGLRPAEAFLGRTAAELSGGERQRLALARAIAARPQLVVADEPTSMLDPDLRIELIDGMRAARDRDGTTFLFITHDLVLARRVCDRLVVLAEGRVVEHGPVEQVLATPCAPETRTLLEAAL